MKRSEGGECNVNQASLSITVSIDAIRATIELQGRLPSMCRYDNKPVLLLSSFLC